MWKTVLARRPTLEQLIDCMQVTIRRPLTAEQRVEHQGIEEAEVQPVFGKAGATSTMVKQLTMTEICL